MKDTAIAEIQRLYTFGELTTGGRRYLPTLAELAKRFDVDEGALEQTALDEWWDQARNRSIKRITGERAYQTKQSTADLLDKAAQRYAESVAKIVETVEAALDIEMLDVRELSALMRSIAAVGREFDRLRQGEKSE